MDKLGSLLGFGHRDDKERTRESRRKKTLEDDDNLKQCDTLTNRRHSTRAMLDQGQRNGQAVLIRRRTDPAPGAASSSPVPAKERKGSSSTNHKSSSATKSKRMSTSTPRRPTRPSSRSYSGRDSTNIQQSTRVNDSSKRHRPSHDHVRHRSHDLSTSQKTRSRPSRKSYVESEADSVESEDNVLASCAICLDDHRKAELHALPCDHYWCRACCKSAFKHSASAPGNMPPKCCKHEIVMDDVRETFRGLFRSQFKHQWRRKYAESKESNPSYCPNATCSAWMPKELFVSDRKGKSPKLVRCTSCDCKVCRTCHKKYHGDKPCKEDSSTRRALRFIRQDANSQICPGCGQGVQKSAGCNHMQCVCGCHFCIKCGSEFVDNACPKKCALVSYDPDPEGDARMARHIHEDFHRIWNFDIFDDLFQDDNNNQRGAPPPPIPLAFRPRILRFGPPDAHPHPPPPPPPPVGMNAMHERRIDQWTQTLTELFPFFPDEPHDREPRPNVPGGDAWANFGFGRQH